LIRVPNHLRQHVANYNLEDWVDDECDLEAHFTTIEILEDRISQGHHAPGDPKVRDSALVVLIATCLDEEMQLEDYVIEHPVSGYDTTKEGAFAPIFMAAGWLIIRRYRKACADGTWPPTTTGTGGNS
jgi:hypothetical protein